MRTRLALLGAVAAAVVPLAPAAHAMYCNELISPVCSTVCTVYRAQGRPCPR